MGFKKFIKSKKILSLFAVFMLSGTNLLMAQELLLPQLQTAAAADKSAMWMGVGYYVLLFLLLAL